MPMPRRRLALVLATLLVAGTAAAGQREDVRAGDAVRVLQDGDRLPVVFTGGLGPFYAAALAADWPVVPARGTGVDGALDMARAWTP